MHLRYWGLIQRAINSMTCSFDGSRSSEEHGSRLIGAIAFILNFWSNETNTIRMSWYAKYLPGHVCCPRPKGNKEEVKALLANRSG